MIQRKARITTLPLDHGRYIFAPREITPAEQERQLSDVNEEKINYCHKKVGTVLTSTYVESGTMLNTHDPLK